jgi:hypothetical protein
VRLSPVPEAAGTRDVLAEVNGFPNPAGQQGHVDVADPEVLRGVDHCVHERRKSAHAARLADSLAPDRVVRGWGHHLERARSEGSPRRSVAGSS